MSDHSVIDRPMSRLANHRTMGAAIGTVLALIAIADALLVAALFPALGGLVMAVLGLAAVALAVPAVTALLAHLRLPNKNDAWVFW